MTKKFLIILMLFMLPAPTLAAEGSGLLYSDLNGALPKALWRDQPRSEINYLLKNLPPAAPLRSVQEIKRNMLLSVYDTRLMENDIEAQDGESFLILRLKKLMEMGLWEDALTLYTKTTQDPKNQDELAQVGVTLILLQKGLSTACLEEKVLAPRFPESDFWTLIDTVCDIELGSEAVIGTQLAESPVIQSIFNDASFKVSANAIEALNKLTPLELAFLSMKKKIDYEGLVLKPNLPPRLIKTFLESPDFPSKQKEALEAQARTQALLPKANLTEKQEDLLKNLKTLTQDQFIPLLSAALKSGQNITTEQGEKLSSLATENPENYFYLQILNVVEALNPTISVGEDNLSAGLAALSTQNREKVNLLKSLLDNNTEFSNNQANVYEKQINLTQDSPYVMSTDGYQKWLRKTQAHRFAGLSLLIILSNIEVDAKTQNTGNNPENTTSNMLKSLSTVGLIDQSHHIAKEILAELMGS